MKPDTRIFYPIYSIILFVAALLWWHSQAALMSYQEQFQLFLFTSDYFADNVTVIGGFADWLGEFVTQFFYVPWLGALAIALTLTLLQVLVGVALIRNAREKKYATLLYAFSATPSLIIWYGLGDENLLMSLPCALILVFLMLEIPTHRTWLWSLVYMLSAVALYWCAGAVALVYVLLAPLLARQLRQRWVLMAMGLALVTMFIILLHNTLYVQYPLQRLWLGLNYYRVPNVYPVVMYVIVGVSAILPLLALVRFKSAQATWLPYAVTAVVAAGAVFVIPAGYDNDKSEAITYDYLVRNQRWHDIIAMAEKKAPTNEFCQQGLNLALAMTGQLGERMFEFPQYGIGSLISAYQNNNTACLISAEAFYHLGMVNSAFRYNFDSQEGIMNDRKSGRMLKRMAECMIINARYKVAEKYINRLSNSLFYRDWALRAKEYLGNEEKIARHPDWYKIRQIRFKREMLYDYSEIEKILGLLALESNGLNRMAWEYFIAATLLKGDLSTMTGIYHYAPEMFAVQVPPKHHQEAIALFWTFGHSSFEGLPYKVSDNVKQQLANFIEKYKQNQSVSQTQPSTDDGHYWSYFIKSQQKAQERKADAPKGQEREG